MDFKEISLFRLINQKIALTKFETPSEIIAWMGAMQAQDYSMVKWAIGLRLLDSSEEYVNTAINNGEIIRTHLMRPTWHFVTAEDIYWILELTAPQIKSQNKSRNRELELTGEIFTKSAVVIEKALSDIGYLTREELELELNKAGIRSDINRLYHMLLEAELNGLICNGPVVTNKHTYSLLHKRVPIKNKLTKDESLAELAKRYFTSHCPATLKDFTWWSGLTVSNARQALEFIKKDLIPEKIGNEIFWFTQTFKDTRSGIPTVHLLPAYDEFLISYKDRSASLTLTDNRKAVSSNGIFRPVIVVDGQVVGLWKRSVKNDKVIIETEFFTNSSPIIKIGIEHIANLFGQHLNKTIDLRYT